MYSKLTDNALLADSEFVLIIKTHNIFRRNSVIEQPGIQVVIGSKQFSVVNAQMPVMVCYVVWIVVQFQVCLKTEK